MKITKVEPIRVHSYLLVQVHTDKGVTGLGESGTWSHLEASEAALAKFGEYLTGQDPFRIEHHWNVMYRSGCFRGSAIMGAISALDIALWDIKGKALGVPIYELLGGQTRQKVRVYVHVKAPTLEEQVQKCREALQQGYTAVGHLNPFLDEERSAPYFKTHAAKIGGAVEAVRQYRAAVGDEVDLCLEIHRRLELAEAIALGREIEPYRPFFYEDPIRPESIDAMAEVAQKVGVPIATGERFFSLHEFQLLLARNAAQYLRPSPCVVGGISGTKKVAALAEAYQKSIVPHNPGILSPVATAACLHIGASIPNLAIQEYSGGEDRPPASEIVRSQARIEQGFMLVPEGPGLGVELASGCQEKHPPRKREIGARLHEDGSVMDQ